jgi:hypothetical protein
LRCLPHPAEIRLCDVYSKRDALHELRREVVEELDYRGPVHVLETRGGVPAELYESSLLIGATNVPDILDVDQLAPGTLLVDDSSPHCFRVDRTVRRLHERQDVLFTEGGMLRAPRPLRQVLYVPADLERIMPTIPAEVIGNYDPQHITGCVLSSLLSACRADLPPTVGLLGPHEPGNDAEHKNGPRGAEVTLTRELRFLPSNWDFALDVDYHVFLGARAANQ